ncbi:MAG: hypothetical protein WDN03_13965 [Rhizomicrobium sp.]
MKLRGLSAMTPSQAKVAMADAAKAYQALNVQYPEPRATFDDYMAHMLHALKLVGPEHGRCRRRLGRRRRRDGHGGLRRQLEDHGAAAERGYREDDLQKIWSGNALRVLKAGGGRPRQAAGAARAE